MLEKMVESKNDGAENRRLGGFLLTTATGAFFVLTFALVYSLFTYNVALAGDNLNLSALVAPVQMAEQAPPPEQATAAPKQHQANERTDNNVPTRRDNIQRADETPVKAPDIVSVNQNQQMARPDGRFKLDGRDSNLSASAGSYTSERGSGNGAGIKDGASNWSKSGVEDAAKTVVVPPPPPMIAKKEEPKAVEPPKKVHVISGGVVNGKASNLVKPAYSAAARAVRAQGKVEVQVTIDEDGRVVAANAVSGNSLLVPAAISAARASRFTPTFLSNQKVKVTGIIVYNFNTF